MFGQQTFVRINTDLLADIRQELQWRYECALAALNEPENSPQMLTRAKACKARCKQYLDEIDQILPREPDAEPVPEPEPKPIEPLKMPLIPIVPLEKLNGHESPKAGSILGRLNKPVHKEK